MSFKLITIDNAVLLEAMEKLMAYTEAFAKKL